MAKVQINKNALVEDVAARVDGVSKSDIEKVISAATESIRSNVAQGNDVTLTGLGKFTRQHRAARSGRNPQTGESVEVPARYSPSFKPGKPFKDVVNGG